MTADAPPAAAVREQEVAGTPLVWREAPSPAAAAPVLYLHGVPTDGGDFAPFLARTGGLAPDLPGFGRSGKGAGFDYSIAGYAGFLERWLDELDLDRFSLVVHDWGAVGLALAQRMPARVERIVVIDAVPLLEGYRWHRLARAWRTPVVGELAMGATSRRVLTAALRRAFTTDGAAVDELAERAWRGFDHGTQRAILKLYRSAPPAELARAGAALGALSCPALVIWGDRDPYLPERFAHAYAGALGGRTEVEIVAGAGHWPWIDRPELAERVAGFLLGG